MKKIAVVISRTVFFTAMLTTFSAPNSVIADDSKVKIITLSTIPSRIPGVNADGHVSNPKRPGFRVEILRSAGMRCGVAVKLAPAPWPRALEMLKNNEVEAVFYSSYTAERTSFGAYPMKNGSPDKQRAMNKYDYSFYVHPDSGLTWDGRIVSTGGADKRILVENDSVAAAMVARAGLEPMGVARYTNMVHMLAEKRAAGMLASDTNIEEILANEPQLAKKIKRLTPPFDSVHGYVMFAKRFYVENTELVECFWDAIGDIRASPAYEALVRSYNNGRFVE